MCCNKGKIKIEENQGEYPDFIVDLFANSEHMDYSNFRKYIRQYNNSLAFASFGAKYIGNSSKFSNNPNGPSPYCLRIDGQIYHNIANNLFTDGKSDASYNQLYCLDPELANEIRLKHPANKGINKEVLFGLEKFISSNNDYAKSYKFLMEVEKEMKEKELETKDLCLVWTNDPTKNQGRYNIPTAK